MTHETTKTKITKSKQFIKFMEASRGMIDAFITLLIPSVLNNSALAVEVRYK
jgi:hypothetical protein